MAWGYLDDEAIAEARSVIGVELRHERFQWVRDVTRDAISHFVQGIGDDNPLYRDAEYARSARWGGLIAPPCFLYAVDLTDVTPKLPGVQAIYAGTDWTWNDVIRAGDTIIPRVVLRDVKVKTGQFAERWALQTGSIEFFREPEHKLVAVAVSHTARMPRGKALKETGKGKYQPRDPHRYTDEKLAEIEKQILAEERRGPEPRFWEDVQVGDTLCPVVKGPLTTTDIIAFYSGTIGQKVYGGAHGDAVRYRQRYPDWHMSEKTGAKDSAGRGHVEPQTGNDVGMGGAYDLAPQRFSWCGHMITNWIGDDGFMRNLSLQARRPNLIGDTTWWNGKVVGKAVEDGQHTVSLEVEATNQLGDVTALGTAVVVLPSQANGPVKVPLTQDFAFESR
jgi:acyl dehydratase